MDQEYGLLSEVLPAADESPFVVEQIAIDITNGLRAAEVGLETFRAQPLLRRLWDGLRGQGREQLAAIGSDLVTAQHATVALIKEIMAEEARTQYCVERVLHNLHSVNRDLDALSEQVLQLEDVFSQKIDLLRTEFYAELRQLAGNLEAEIQHINYKVEREAAMRRLQVLFQGGNLHSGTGELFNAALYLAQVARLYAGESTSRMREERKFALEVVRQKIGGIPKYVPDLILQDIEKIQDKQLETVAYLSSRISKPGLMVFNDLAERRMVGVRVNREITKEKVEIVRKLHDPESRLSSDYLYPHELVERLAEELLDIPFGGI